VFVGHDAIRGWYAQLRDAFEDLRFEVEELIDSGTRVVVDRAAAPRSSCTFPAFGP
jgi:ketosteroid isomerase-like protein